jgi:DNA-binding NarL/FixJ family response regulator
VTKTSALEDLLAAVRAVLKGQVYVCPEVLGTVMQIHNSQPETEEGAYTKLTGREREVLQMLVEGISTKEIAGKLFLSVPTVHTHRQHILQKTGSRSVADLVRYALREGIISSEQ